MFDSDLISNKNGQSKHVWFAFLPERCVYDISFDTAMRMMAYNVRRGYQPIYTYYGRTDITRQGICDAFLQVTKDPHDTLVMLDIDHIHPENIVEHLANRDKPVIVPLMFRRAEPYQACAFIQTADGLLHNVAEFPRGVHRVNGVGSGAIAIQRQVFTTLQEKGHDWFFQYEYGPKRSSPSEDMYFSKICREAGIETWLDCDIETPHITYGFVDRQAHDEYQRDNPAPTMTLNGPNGHNQRNTQYATVGSNNTESRV